jgi:ATP-binding cassette, subfamily B, multidrug efflux pump
MIIIIIIQGALEFINRYLMEFVAHNVIHKIRGELYSHLTGLSFSFYDKARTGDLMTRVTADTDNLKTFFGFAFMRIITNILILTGILIVMLIWNFKLALIYIIISPLIVHAMRNYSLKVRPVYGQARKRLGMISDRINDLLEGIEVVKVFAREDFELSKFTRENDKYLKANVKGGKISALWMPYVDFITGLGIGLVLLIGGRWVINGEISPGVLLGFITYMSILLRPIRQTGMMFNITNKAIASLKRINSIFEIESEIKEKKDAYVLDKIRGNILFNNVSFSYNKSELVLNDINLEVDAGETVALVGPSGAGKSTLVHLIPRFYDVDRGEVLIDGHNVLNLKLSSLRKRIGIILQSSFLFGTTIAENIAYGKPDASMKEIIEVAKIAQIHDFISSLPQGYDTQIGEKGARLSGGQKQRIEIARVLLTDPEILIMDEPASNIDVKTEENLNKAIKMLIKGRTTFIIAHRLWTVKNADKIVLLNKGRIVEIGTHKELIKREGLYKELYLLNNWSKEGEQ